VKRVVEFPQLLERQFADVVGKSRLLKAHQSIAVDRTIVLEAFGRAYGNLGGQARPLGEDRSADYRRESRIN
jgi:hypothetical protein